MEFKRKKMCQKSLQITTTPPLFSTFRTPISLTNGMPNNIRQKLNTALQKCRKNEKKKEKKKKEISDER